MLDIFLKYIYFNSIHRGGEDRKGKVLGLALIHILRNKIKIRNDVAVSSISYIRRIIPI